MQANIEMKLRMALAKLAEDNVEKISVSALCEKAGISRASFYIYYRSLDDLISRTREYIINRLDEQFTILVEVKNEEFSEKNCKIFNDVDLALLKGFTGNRVYWDFLINANRVIFPRFRQKMIELHGEKLYQEKKEEFEFILNGSIVTYYFDLIDYDEQSFIKNIKRVYRIVQQLLFE